MSELLRETFAALRQKGEKALVPYITAGYPRLEATVPLIHALDEGGGDVIELGIPFSDPLADGPVIQATASTALRAGFRLPHIFASVQQAREDGCQRAIVLLVYYNNIYRYGLTRFVDQAAQAGVDGLVIPDLPLEESEALRREAEAAGLSLISLVAPTTSDERLAKIAEVARGFIYLVTVTGVTGQRDSLPAELHKQVERVRRYTDVPVCLGFGISTPEQVRRVSSFADGAIVGSALLKRLSTDATMEELCSTARRFVGDLKSGTTAKALA